MTRKRHVKGQNSSDEKKRRRLNAEKWASTRGDENQNRWSEANLVNQRFEAFYRAQGFLKDSADEEAFLKALRAPLPACFRISLGNEFADDLRQQLHTYLQGFSVATAAEGEEETSSKEVKLEPMDWYPGNLAYRLPTDRRAMRKDPNLKALHKWMVQHTDNGNITRQEAVSMVPPVALSVEPHHRVLDMCAAPGSKTSQLLEMVNLSLKKPAAEQGLVVANDADTDRAYMLVHQCRRAVSPLLVVTTHKGQNFPKIVDTGAPAQAVEAAEQTLAALSHQQNAFFDRVLCDVPCSGDGTMRKNPTIWEKWAVSQSQSLHALQLLIARRGLQLLKPGGLMVYSTCSMSPFENESVVAQLLRENPDTLELVEARDFLPKFTARKGMSDWYVLDDFFAVKREIIERKVKKRAAKQDAYFAKKRAAAAAAAESGEEVPKTEGENETAVVVAAEEENVDEEANSDKEENVSNMFSDILMSEEELAAIEDPALRECLKLGMRQYKVFDDIPKNLQHKFKQSFFPPTKEEAEWMKLERCLRCLPQDEDTGGFFVVTLRKKEAPAKKEVEAVVEATVSAEEEAAATAAAAAAAASEEATPAPAKEVQKQKGLVEFQQWDPSYFNVCKEFYDFDETLTNADFCVREDMSSIRNAKLQGVDPNAVTSKTVYYIPSTPRALMTGDVNHQLKVVAAGVKMFEKKTSTAGAEYRLVQEGVDFIKDHFRARKVPVLIQDLCNLLGGGLVSGHTLSPAVQEELAKLSTGVVVCTYKYRKEDYLTVEERKALGVLPTVIANTAEGEQVTVEFPENGPRDGDFEFNLVCWRGSNRTINVMCGKVEVESMKHRLEALGVLRPKISSKDLAIQNTAAPEAEAMQVEEATPATEVAME